MSPEQHPKQTPDPHNPDFRINLSDNVPPTDSYHEQPLSPEAYTDQLIERVTDNARGTIEYVFQHPDGTLDGPGYTPYFSLYRSGSARLYEGLENGGNTPVESIAFKQIGALTLVRYDAIPAKNRPADRASLAFFMDTELASSLRDAIKQDPAIAGDTMASLVDATGHDYVEWNAKIDAALGLNSGSLRITEHGAGQNQERTKQSTEVRYAETPVQQPTPKPLPNPRPAHEKLTDVMDRARAEREARQNVAQAHATTPNSDQNSGNTRVVHHEEDLDLTRDQSLDSDTYPAEGDTTERSWKNFFKRRKGSTGHEQAARQERKPKPKPFELVTPQGEIINIERFTELLETLNNTTDSRQKQEIIKLLKGGYYQTELKPMTQEAEDASRLRKSGVTKHTIRNVYFPGDKHYPGDPVKDGPILDILSDNQPLNNRRLRHQYSNVTPHIGFGYTRIPELAETPTTASQMRNTLLQQRGLLERGNAIKSGTNPRPGEIFKRSTTTVIGKDHVGQLPTLPAFLLKNSHHDSVTAPTQPDDPNPQAPERQTTPEPQTQPNTEHQAPSQPLSDIDPELFAQPPVPNPDGFNTEVLPEHPGNGSQEPSSKKPEDIVEGEVVEDGPKPETAIPEGAAKSNEQTLVNDNDSQQSEELTPEDTNPSTELSEAQERIKNAGTKEFTDLLQGMKRAGIDDQYGSVTVENLARSYFKGDETVARAALEDMYNSGLANRGDGSINFRKINVL